MFWRIAGKIFLALATMFMVATSALAAESFKIGVAPHTSARVIVEQYQALRNHLEQALGMPVEIVTAPDFTEYARRALEQQYDLAITTGHQSRMLQTDADYLPLLTYKADFTAVVVAAANGPVSKPSDLNGTRVLGLSPSSLVTLWGTHWLKNAKVTDTTLDYVSAADSVSQLVIGRAASAGFISQANFDRLSPAVQSRLKILVESPPMAGRVYMLNQRQAKRREDILSALWSFADTPEAKHYFNRTKLDGYRKLRSGELEAMDPFAEEVRQVIRKSRN